MPMVYGLSLATAGASTTNGTTNTESSAFTIKNAAALPTPDLFLQAVYVSGAGNALTAISGLRFRVIRCTTASATTGGVAITPAPKIVGSTAATGLPFSAVTTISSTGRSNHLSFGCGAAGPGGWVAPNPDSMITLRANATPPSIDLVSVATNINMTYEWSAEYQE